MKTTLDKTVEKLANADDELRHKIVFDHKFIDGIARKFGMDQLADGLSRKALSTIVTKDSDEKQFDKMLRVVDNCHACIDILPQHAARQLGVDLNDLVGSRNKTESIWAKGAHVASAKTRAVLAFFDYRLGLGELNRDKVAGILSDTESSDSAKREKALRYYTAIATYVRNTRDNVALKMFNYFKELSQRMDLAPLDGRRIEISKIKQYDRLEHLMISAFDNVGIKGIPGDADVKGNPEMRNSMVIDTGKFREWRHFNIELGLMLERHAGMTLREKRELADILSKNARNIIFSADEGLMVPRLVASKDSIYLTVESI